MRTSGIDIIGNVPWGTHFCQFYETGQDLIETLVPYFRAGLEANEFCMWLTSAPLQAARARSALKAAVPDMDSRIKKGQLEIMDSSQWYTKSRKFSADEVLQGWVEKHDAALRKGYEGLRMTGNTFWLEQENRDDFAGYERSVNDVISRYKMLAVCTYSPKKCRATEILDVMANHEFALVRQQGRWQVIESAHRKSIERALQESSLFPEQNPQPVLRIAADGTLLYANEASNRLLDLWGSTAGRLIPGEVLQAVTRSLDTGTVGEFELTAGPVTFLVAVAPIVANGYANLYAAEITSRKEAEAALKAEIEERTRAQERLAEANHRINIILDTIADGFYALDRQWRFMLINDTALKHFGMRREEVLGRTLFEVFPVMLGTPQERDFRRAMDEGKLTRIDAPSLFSDRFVEMFLYPGQETMTVIFRDITERKVSEKALLESQADLKHRGEELRQLNRILAARSRSDQAMMRAQAEADYLHEVCRIVVEDCGHAMVWIGLAENDPEKSVRPVASAGFEKGYLETLRISWADTERGRGPTGTAIRNGRPAGCDDMTADPKFAPWRAEALKRGYASSLALPLRVGGMILGAITIYARRPKAFSPDETKLLTGLADDTAYGISALRLRLAHELAEAALRQSEERYRSLVDLSPEAIFINRDDRIAFVNPAAIRLFGASSAEDLIGRSIWEIFHPDYHALVRDRVRIARSGKRQPLVEEKIVRRDGTAVDVEVASAPFSTEQGPAFQVILRDITARKRVEEDLRQRSLELQQLTETLEQRVLDRTAELGLTNERLRQEIAERRRLVAAVEQDGEGVVITDASGSIDYVNPAFERLSGLSRDELRGKAYAGILTGGGGDPEAAKRLEEAIASARAWSGHATRKSKAGQTAELEVALSPIRDEAGTVVNFLAIERDVTHEMRLQQHLRQTQKTEALGTLAGGIAHDLNNVLNPIFINTELVLLDAPLDENMRRSLEMTLKAAERGRDLVKQIITFSRQKEKERKPLKVAPLVAESLKFLRASLPKSVEIRESLEEERGLIMADPVQVHQVIMNLCSNAAFAMRDRGGVLEVCLAEVEVDEGVTRRHPGLKPGPYLRLTVADSGKGMTPDVMERAFDPFFTTKGPGEGSGMGLAVVQGIVRDHGGAITVYSEVGHGSTFNVYFPRFEGRGEPMDATPQTIVGGGEEILLVDDEEAQVLSVKNMLERIGYRVTAKTGSPEALVLFREDPERFDLVITDQAMPRMMGGKLAEEMLKIRPNLPIILCTGFSEQIDANGAAKMGLSDFLMKPFSVREISGAIRKALSRKQK